MGGCRCSYRNCNVKTDGKTHMFHYPVFDRLRCHQWLLNAHKLDFLNLKVSQLKNRVVCQHHFRDDNFMNFKKDKLTFDAVPTENGPYCDPTQFSNNNEENLQSFPLISEDIENDSLLYCDKRANYSVKYGDFLTNNEINFMNTLNTDTIDVDLKNANQINEDNLISKIKTSTQINTMDPERCSNVLIFESDAQSKLINPVKPCVASGNRIEPKNKTIQLSKDTMKENAKHLQEKNISMTNGEPMIYVEVPLGDNKEVDTYSKKKKEPKVKIISEKKINEPIQIPKNLQSVSPSILINIPQRKQVQNSLHTNNQKSINGSNIINKPLTENYVVDLEYEPTLKQEVLELPSKQIVRSDSTSNQTSPKKQVSKSQLKGEHAKVTLLKNKISPQRIAAIEEKRRFNMKLRDMIQTCLDKQNLINSKAPQNIECTDNAKENKKDINDSGMRVSTYLSKKTELPSAHEYTLAYFDARMQRLENTLLNKIDQNTQKIMELKNSLSQSSENMNTANTSVQTRGNEECYKKYLFQEISKFLSPSSNSLVYEELFINKYSLEKDNSPKSKRRRCR